MLKKITRVMPLWSFFFFIAAALAAGIQIACAYSTPFADFFNSIVSGFFRALLSHLTVWIPFSLAETLLYALPILFVVLLVVCIRAARESFLPALRCILGTMSVGALIYVLFVLTFSAGYRATPLDEKLGIETEALSADDLYEAAVFLSDRAAQELDEILFERTPEVANGIWHYRTASSVMPYSYDTLSKKLVRAYNTVCAEYPFIQKLDSRVKPLSISPLMTYTHISGVYTMFTGEANLNTNYPDYVIPFTAAHELAHQRGIARENEANFIAFLVCVASDDPYIRYSGYVNMYEYVLNALNSASREKKDAAVRLLDDNIYCELVAYAKFYEKYTETVVSKVSDTVNDTYLKIQGTEGVKSYGMVVDLAVAYLKANP